MRKILLSLTLLTQLFAADTNTTITNDEIIALESDPLFHAKRERGLSLHDALNRAIKLSNKLDASYQTVIQDKQKVIEAEAGHLPVVNLSGDVGQEVRTIKADDTNPEVGDVAPLQKVFNYQKTDLYLTITENLWNGGSIENSIDERDALLKSSLYDYRDKLESLVVTTAQAYFNVVYNEIALKIAQKNMKSYEKILSIVSIKEKSGAATKGDVNFIRANVDNAKSDLVQRHKALSDSVAQYVYLLQTETLDDLPFETQSVIYKGDLNTSLKLTDELNAKLLKNRAYIKAARFGFLATSGSFQPKVDFTINAETRNEFNDGTGERNKANALLTFNYNLYNGNKDEATAIRLLSKMREQQYLYKDLKRSLTFDVKVLQRSVSSLSESLKLTESEVLAARKVTQSYWIAFQHGTQDLQALQLAQRNLNRAEQDYANYKKNLITNNFELMQKTGTLLQQLALEYTKDAAEFKEEDLHYFEAYQELK